MSSGAVIMLIVGLVLVWGGLAVSVGWAVHVHRRGDRGAGWQTAPGPDRDERP